MSEGFAADGAWHIKSDSNNQGKITWDRTRKRPNVVIHDWPIMTGSTPDEHLIERFKFNDNAASSIIVASTGNNGNWETSEGVNRNTDNDTVSTDIFRDSGLDTVDTYHADLATTVYTNAVYKSGAVLLSFTPQFGYDDAADQTLFHLYVDADDYIQLCYDVGNDRYELRVSWGGTLTTINDFAYTANTNLQQPTRLLIGWDSDQDFLFMAKNGQMVDTGTNTGIPSASAASYVHVGANSDGDGTTGLNADVYLDGFKAYNDCILPYGAFHVGNGQGLLADIDNPHSDLIFFWDCQADAAKCASGLGSSKSGTSSGQYIVGAVLVGTNGYDTNGTSGQITFTESANDMADYNTGTLGIWFNLQTTPVGGEFLFDVSDADDSDRIQAVFDSSGNIDVTYTSASTAEAITGDIACATGEWHYLLVRWDDTGKLRSWIDGVENGTGQDIANVWAGGSGLTWYFGEDHNSANGCDMYIGRIFITDEAYTPEIPTAFGKPIWLPLVRDDS